MGKQICINAIVLEFTQCPGPRYCDQGDDSGEEFYHKILNEAFYKAYIDNKKLLLDLDGPDGYASSFLDEAYGNLIYDFGVDIVKNNVIIKSDEEPEWIDMLNGRTLLKWQDRIKKQDAPKVTIEHKPWYRLVDGQMKKAIWLPFKK